MFASKPVTEGGRAIRHVVIFDDHPASLRLLSDSVVPPRRNGVLYAGFAVALVLAAGLGVFWPLL